MSITMLAILAAATGSAATPATPPPGPAPFKAVYHAKRDVYCLRNDPDAHPQPEHGISGSECRSQAYWARQGLKISRRASKPR